LDWIRKEGSRGNRQRLQRAAAPNPVLCKRLGSAPAAKPAATRGTPVHKEERERKKELQRPAQPALVPGAGREKLRTLPKQKKTRLEASGAIIQGIPI